MRTVVHNDVDKLLNGYETELLESVPLIQDTFMSVLCSINMDLTEAVEVGGHHPVLGWRGRAHGDHHRHVLEAGAEAADVEQVLVTGPTEHNLQGPDLGIGWT